MSSRLEIAFGLRGSGTSAASVDALAQWLESRLEHRVVTRSVDSYAALISLLRKGRVQFAWLPPIPFVHLVSDGVVRELVVGDRGEGAAYVAVLIGRPDGPFSSSASLGDARVAWVDPLSASGYVIPRLRLAARGVDHARVWSSEIFTGSHVAAVRAVLDGSVDVAATYGGFDPAGQLVRGAFQEIGVTADRVRVLESFGEVPPDVVAVHASVPRPVMGALAAAFEHAHDSPEMLDAIHRTFGVRKFVRGLVSGYDLLRTEVALAASTGVIASASALFAEDGHARAR